MSYIFQTLPYAHDALEPIIDKETVHFHKDKHHQTYFNNFVNAIKDTEFNGKSLVEIFANISKLPVAVRNNAGGYFNHDLYFNAMRAPSENNAPKGELLVAIERDFGSFEAFKEQFSAQTINHFGSGWGWLVVGSDKKLHLTHTANQDNPLMDIAEVKGTPILVCDVWEHSYYLQYQNLRADYVNKWWQLVNWDMVSQWYQEALA